MAPHAIPIDSARTWAARRASEKTNTQHLALNAEDGTLHLLRSGFIIASLSGVSLLLTLFAFGGVGPDGPHTNPGWLSLIIALMSMPFGLLLLLLGGAKWLRNRHLSMHSPQRAAGV